MSHHSTCPMLCRASQAEADWEIAACPQAQEIIDYFTAVFQCFAVGTVWLLGPNRDAGGNIHCNSHPLPISLIPSYPHAVPFPHVPSLLHRCRFCCKTLSLYVPRSPGIIWREVPSPAILVFCCHRLWSHKPVALWDLRDDVFLCWLLAVRIIVYITVPYQAEKRTLDQQSPLPWAKN